MMSPFASNSVVSVCFKRSDGDERNFPASLHYSNTPLPHFPSRREFVHLSRHEILVLVPDPIARAGDAPDEMQFLILAEYRVIVEDRNCDGIAFAHRTHKTFRLFIRIDLHRAAPFGENVNLLLVSVIVRRPRALMRLEDR